MSLFFSRDTKVYIEIGTQVWEIPVQDGFSFSQATNSSEVTLNEMTNTAGVSRRGSKMFNDSYAPAEWSFSTYMRPFKSTGDGAEPAYVLDSHHAIEEALWALMVGDASTAGAGTAVDPLIWTQGVTASGTELTIDFADSNKSVLGTANIYFVLGGNVSASGNPIVYRISECCVNEAAMEFDIDGIAMINWSGMGQLVTDTGITAPTATHVESINSQNNFIRNRLTTLTLTDNLNTVGEVITPKDYNVVLTGGNITISNNMTYLTPETIGSVNQPLGHVTGSRSISGSFTSYIVDDADGTADLFDSIIRDTTTITNSFELVFGIGGSAVPFVSVTMPTCHLEVPSHSIEDVIALEVNFKALPTSIDLTNEATIVYTGTTY
jgi:hypothetical protein